VGLVLSSLTRHKSSQVTLIIHELTRLQEGYDRTLAAKDETIASKDEQLAELRRQLEELRTESGHKAPWWRFWG
jgi:hypothetical protein